MYWNEKKRELFMQTTDVPADLNNAKAEPRSLV